MERERERDNCFCFVFVISSSYPFSKPTSKCCTETNFIMTPNPPPFC